MTPLAIKPTLAAIFLIMLLIACKKDDDINVPDNPSYKGNFVSAVHPTSGTAAIDQDETTLTLSSFKTDSGPDLNVYLSTSIQDVTGSFIDLGDIKGVDGGYTYDLPGNIDFTQYKYVVVWCVEFDVNFGYAELVEQ